MIMYIVPCVFHFQHNELVGWSRRTSATRSPGIDPPPTFPFEEIFGLRTMLWAFEERSLPFVNNDRAQFFLASRSNWSWLNYGFNALPQNCSVQSGSISMSGLSFSSFSSETTNPVHPLSSMLMKTCIDLYYAGQSAQGAQTFYDGQRSDLKVGLEKQPNKESRDRPRNDRFEARREDYNLPRTFEGLEQNFHEDIVILSKELHDAEDAENARHREV